MFSFFCGNVSSSKETYKNIEVNITFVVNYTLKSITKKMV